MTRTKVTLLGAGLFLLGGALGIYTGFTYAVSTVSDLMISSSATSTVSNTATHVRTLQFLREGNVTRAIDYLETLLDGDLIGVGAYHAEYVPPYTGKIMTTAAEYRTKYPRRTENAEIDAAVQRALSTGKP